MSKIQDAVGRVVSRVASAAQKETAARGERMCSGLDEAFAGVITEAFEDAIKDVLAVHSQKAEDKSRE